MPIIAQHFYMIRHGETEANAARLMAGSLDTPLTAHGRKQAEDTQILLDRLLIKPKTIVHSHLSRARDTAALLNQNLNLPLYEDADLAEWHAGDWEGATYEKCRRLLVDWITPPNGESPETFLKRTKSGINRALESKNTPTMIVCHGGVFRAFCKLYGFESQGVANCVLYEFKPNISDTIFPWTVYEHSLKSTATGEPTILYETSNVSASKIA